MNIEAVSIKKLSKIFNVNADTIKTKIPEKFIFRIGKSVRYDLNGIVEYFRCGGNKHSNLIDEILS